MIRGSMRQMLKSRFNRVYTLALWMLILGLPAAWISAQDKARKPSREQVREEQEEYYQKWLREDAVYLINEQEKEVFLKLSTDDERDAFIEQFWRRRDADHSTAENEFKEEHYRRIAYANEHFHSGEPGWKTDRGEIYIKFGPPDGRDSSPSGGRYARRLDEGGGTTNVYPFERWRYNYIEGIGPNVEIEFVDPSGTGEYRLALSPQDKDALLFVDTQYAGKTEAEAQGLEGRWLRITRDAGLGIQARSPYYAIHPDDFPFEKLSRTAQLQSAPINPDARKLRERVQTQITFGELPFRVFQSPILLSRDQYWVPITVEVENRWLHYTLREQAYRTEIQVYGIISDLSGRIQMEFDEALSNHCSADELEAELEKRSLFQKAARLPAGRYKLEIYLQDQHGRFGTFEEAIVLAAASGDELRLSPIILADLIAPQEPASEAFEQFLLGGLRVVPNVEGVFSPSDDVHVYLQAYGVGLDQSTLAPSLNIRYFLMKEGRVVEAFPDADGKSIQYVSPRRVVLRSGFRLTRLEPGAYGVVVLVQDNVSGREVRGETSFLLRGEK